MATETTEQIVREAPEIEAYKLGLLQSAKALPAPVLPGYKVAGMSDEQTSAIRLGMSGIGAYKPYMEAAGQGVGAGTQTTQEAANLLRGADTRGQFAAAQSAMNQAGIPIQQMGQAAQGITAAQQMAQQYAQANMGQSMGTLQQGIGALQGAAQMYSPQLAEQFMNPYQQQVIDESLRQINRQGDISRQNLQAQATRAGAFGGSREGVQRAELERAMAEQRNAAIVGGLSQGYQQAAGQAQQAFEQQQGRQLAQAQGFQGLGGLYGQQALQQAQLGQGAAGLQGSLAGQQANIYGQQSQLGQSMAQGIGGLAGQQFGIGAQMSSGLGSLGGQLGNLGMQQASLGQTTQALGQQDVNFQYNLGSQLQRQAQAELDAQRATSMQTAMQPQQQLAFLSDIYKGAPSTQMSAMTQNQAAPSPFQQIAGLGAGALATAGAAKTAGLF